MRMHAAIVLVIAATIALSALPAFADEPAARKAPDRASYDQLAERVFQAGGYVNFLWEWGGPRPPEGDYTPYFTRLRSMGIWGTSMRYGETEGQLWSAPRELGFPHYIETTTGVIIDGEDAKTYEAAKKAFGESTDPAADKLRLLVRHPCFSDPAVRKKAAEHVGKIATESADAQPFFYGLGAEIGLGTHGAASPVCFCEHCLAGFRAWLRSQYADIAALNAQWQSQFKGLDEVVPETVREAAERVKKTGVDNFSPFVDHRLFMDTVMPRYYGQLQAIVDGQKPAAAGCLMTRAISESGWDLWRLSRSARFIEHNDINYHADQPELMRSFSGPDGFWVRAHELEFGGLNDVYNTWRRVLNGYNAGVLFEMKTLKFFERTYPDYPLADNGKLLAPAFRAIRDGAAAQLSAMKLDDRAIAILYSRSSEHARWAQDGWRPIYYADGSTRNHYDDTLVQHAREAWCLLLEDCGLQYHYVSYEQLDKGELEGVKLLVLPECEALSDRQCERIEKFVEAGGSVVADCFVATMDEHGRRRADGGRLDKLFGIVRKQPGKSLLLETGMKVPCGGTVDQLMAGRYPHRMSGQAGGAVAGTGLTVGGASLAKGADLNVPAVEAGLDYADDVTHLAASDSVKAVAVRTAGKGKAIFLNLRMGKYMLIDPYPDFRYSAEGDGARALAAAVAKLAGISPRFAVEHKQGRKVAPVEILPFDGRGGATLLAVVPNYHYAGCGLPGSRANAQIDGKDLSHEPYAAQIVAADKAEMHVYDVLAGKYLGRQSATDVTIDPAKPVLLARLPYKVESMDVRVTALPGGGGYRVEAAPTADTAPAKGFAPHVIRVDLLTADKNALPLGRVFAVCDAAGKATATVAADSAKWRGEAGKAKPIGVRVTDVLTGRNVEDIGAMRKD